MQSQPVSQSGFAAAQILSDEDYHSLFLLWPDMFCLATDDGTIIDVNPACERILGYKTDEMVGKKWDDFSHPEDLLRTQAEVERQIAGDKAINFVNRYPCKDGDYRYIQWHGMATGTNHLVGIGRDVTQEVQRSELFAKVAQNERNRVSAALHDGVSQQLFGLRMIANQLRKSLEKNGSDMAARAALMEQIAHDSLQAIRNVMDGMEPCGKDPAQLGQILLQYAERIGNLYDIRCVCEIETEALDISPDVANQLCLITQEAVMNAVKHASASYIKIVLQQQANIVSICVEDDGKGMEVKQATTGLGLGIIRDRASLLGASLKIYTGESGGTGVRCDWETSAAPLRACSAALTH